MGTVTIPDATRFKNKLINGNFDIWQRDTSFAVAGAASNTVYNADRYVYWAYAHGGTSAAGTISRQAFTLGQTDVPNEPTYFWRMANSTAGASLGVNSYHQLRQSMEDVRTLAGRTASFSFYARSTIGSKKIVVELAQYFGTGGSPSSIVSGFGYKEFTLTTSWQKCILENVSIPSISGKTLGTNNDSVLWLDIFFQAGSGFDARLGQTGGFAWGGTGNTDIAQVQVEEGSAATEFDQRHIAQELALCQRYYEVHGGVTQTVPTLTAYAQNVQPFGYGVPFIVQKRAAPTLTKNGTWGVSNCGQPAVGSSSVYGYYIYAYATGTTTCLFFANSADDTITADAEY